MGECGLKKVVVIGGGIAGLASATLLAHEGYEVELLERNDRLGGRAGTLNIEGFRFDTGPSWYLMPEVFEHYFQMIGTTAREQLDLMTLDPGYKVYAEPEERQHAEPHSVGHHPATHLTVPYGLNQVCRVFEEREAGSGKRLERYVKSARKTSHMAERYFLYNTFQSWKNLASREVLVSLPRLVQLLGTSLEHFVARRFKDPLLRQILGYPAVFLGTEPQQAPAMYHLMSSMDLDEGVFYPRGGFWQLVRRLEALAVEAGVTITTRATVTQIGLENRSGKQPQHASVNGVHWRDTDGAEHFTQAGVVVSAADLHHTETQLLPHRARSYPERWWRSKQSGPGAVLVLLGVEGDLPQLEHHTLFFTKDWDSNFDAIFGRETLIPNPASIYVCKPSASDPTVAPSGHENLFVLVPIPADPQLGAGGRNGAGDDVLERAADAAIDQIASWAHIPDLKERIVVRQTIGPADFANDYNSWKGGMLGPSHILSQSAMFRAQNKSRRVENLYYAGATTAPGVGVPMCLISAELVLKHLRGDTSAGPLPAPITGSYASGSGRKAGTDSGNKGQFVAPDQYDDAGAAT